MVPLVHCPKCGHTVDAEKVGEDIVGKECRHIIIDSQDENNEIEGTKVKYKDHMIYIQSKRKFYRLFKAVYRTYIKVNETDEVYKSFHKYFSENKALQHAKKAIDKDAIWVNVDYFHKDEKCS